MQNNNLDEDWLKLTAVEEIYDEYAKILYDHLYYFLNCRQDLAQDITSDVFLKLVQEKDRYKVAKSSFKAWLFRIARNAALNRLKRESKSNPLDDQQTQLDSEQERALEKMLLGISLDQALSMLPDQWREAVLLRYRAELNYEEVAMIMDISQAHARQLVSRAIKVLKSKVK